MFAGCLVRLARVLPERDVVIAERAPELAQLADLDGAPQLLHNELAGRGNWLLVKVKGKGPNTDAIGAVITVTAGGVVSARPSSAGRAIFHRTTCVSILGWGRRRSLTASR